MWFQSVCSRKTQSSNFRRPVFFFLIEVVRPMAPSVVERISMVKTNDRSDSVLHFTSTSLALKRSWADRSDCFHKIKEFLKSFSGWKPNLSKKRCSLMMTTMKWVEVIWISTSKRKSFQFSTGQKLQKQHEKLIDSIVNLDGKKK